MGIKATLVPSSSLNSIVEERFSYLTVTASTTSSRFSPLVNTIR